MSIYTAILSIHILSAFVIGLFVFLSVYSIFTNKLASIKNLSKNLVFSSLFQVLSGSVLMFLSESGNLFNFCKNISIYLTVVMVTEYALFVKSKNSEIVYPKGYVFSGVFLSLVITLFTVLFFI